MSQDLTAILRDWEYDPDKTVRKIWGDDGTQKLQVRVEQGGFSGVLQMALEGRPDGKHPYGFEFVLDYYRDALAKYREKNGSADGFSLDAKACQELFDESIRIYGRYVFLLQIAEYDRIVQDTERNMELFRFVNEHGEQEEDRNHLERWWPYIMRIHATAKAMLAVRAEEFDLARGIIQSTREAIMALPEVDADEFRVERERSEKALNDLERQVEKRKPLSHEEKLERRLTQLVKMEAYERAAEIRDEIRKLRDDES